MPDEPSSAISLAMPKSSSLGEPSAVTRMFVGLRSRCTTRLRCAWLTASQTRQNNCRRSRTDSFWSLAVADRSGRRRRTPSPGRARRRAWRRRRAAGRCTGCSSDARIWRSARKRRSDSPPSRPRTTLMATRCSKSSPSRTARKTLRHAALADLAQDPVRADRLHRQRRRAHARRHRVFDRAGH